MRCAISTIARLSCTALRRSQQSGRAKISPTRHIATSGTGGNSNSGGGDDDEFGLDGFITDDDKVEDIEQTMTELSGVGKDMTPELASELVAKMVEAATKSHAERKSSHGGLLSAITPHTISVLKASRITTNHVQAAASDVYPYPLSKKVVAHIDLDALQLSRPARMALEILAGPRLKDNMVKISCNRYQSSAENQAFAVTVMDRLVSAAKEAVGEEIDSTPLESWEDVSSQVEKLAAEEIEQAGGLAQLLGHVRS